MSETCDDTIEWTRGTVEYLRYLVTADVELDTQPVYFTFDRAAFLTAEWDGTDTVVRGQHQRVVRRLMSDADFPDKAKRLWIRVTDNPESPLIPAGTITFT